MLVGEDGPLGVPYDDFASAYLIGSIALAVILFEGGLKTPVAMVRLAFWPAAVLATLGVAVTAAVLGLFISLVDGVPLLGALLAGAAAAPTDAAAVAVLLRRAGAALPERLLAVLEVESGLNDPMSVFLTFLLMRSDSRTRLDRGRRGRAFIPEGDDRRRGARPGRRLGSDARVETFAARGVYRPCPGAGRRAQRVRPRPASRHAAGFSRPTSPPSSPALRSTARASTSSIFLRVSPGSPRSCCF